MPKVYDPILCMMVDKPATRTTDAKGGKYEIYGDVVTLKSATPATVKYETSNGFVQTIGRKKWDELAKKVNDAIDSKTIDKAIKAIDANGEPLINLKTGVTVGWIIDKGKRLVKNSYGNVYKVSAGDLAWLRSKQSKGIVPEDIKAVGERMIDLE